MKIKLLSKLSTLICMGALTSCQRSHTSVSATQANTTPPSGINMNQGKVALEYRLVDRGKTVAKLIPNIKKNTSGRRDDFPYKIDDYTAVHI